MSWKILIMCNGYGERCTMAVPVGAATVPAARALLEQAGWASHPYEGGTDGLCDLCPPCQDRYRRDAYVGVGG